VNIKYSLNFKLLLRLKYVTLTILAVVSVIGMTGVFAQEYSDDDPIIKTPDVFVTQKMPVTPTTTNSTDLSNQIIQLKNTIIILEGEIERLHDDVFQLDVENQKLKNNNNVLQENLENLQNIINEQIKVMMDMFIEMKNYEIFD